jgi:CheY-like chemotaxis protein/phosphoribosyl 1,2-cyclic phosphodiesterase
MGGGSKEDIMHVRFWGTRGSLPTPGPTTLRYGGNTACVEVRTAEGTLIVLDCGSGAYGLGQSLLAEASGPRHGHLLISHTHWDHIQGFPFFAPLFVPGHVWDIYGPGGLGGRLEETLAGQMEYAYFPITLEQLGATVRYHDLVEGTFTLDDVCITTRYLNHPALTLGYRLEADGVVLVYATDHEPHARPQPDQPGEIPVGALPVHHEDRGHIEFLSGADLIVHDAQYTAAEYAQKIGWGHSPVTYVVDVALAAHGKRLALFHHDPAREDAELDEVLEMCRERAAAAQSPLDIIAAAEGQWLELSAETVAPATAAFLTPPGLVGEASRAAGTSGMVLIVDDDPDIIGLLMATLRPEGFHLLSAGDGETALALARAERPALILLDWMMPGCTGLEVCRALRAEADLQLRQVPVVLLTSRSEGEDIAAGFAAGATDYLTKPFKPSYVRSRVRSWLLRSQGGPAPAQPQPT